MFTLYKINKNTYICVHNNINIFHYEKHHQIIHFPLLTIIGFNSCASIPLKIGESENNSTYTVSYLFEHDGCKVYRFYDKGNYVYFTTRGDVTSITNDSTAQRTITINKTPYE